MKKVLLLALILLGMVGIPSVVAVTVAIKANKQEDPLLAKDPYEALYATGKILFVNSDTGGKSWGSAFCIKIDKDRSWWITCNHVIEWEAGWNATLWYFRENGRFDPVYVAINIVKTDIYKYPTDEDNGDVSLFSTTAKPTKRLNLADEKEVSELPEESETFGVGVMDGIEPPVITIGKFRFHRDYQLADSSGGWLGSSGGPLINRKTMNVLGIRYRMAIGKSNWIYALRIDIVKPWILETIK